MRTIAILALLGLLFWCLCITLLERVTALTLAQSTAIVIVAACVLALLVIRMIERSE